MLRRLPTHYLDHLAGRDQALLAPPGTQQLTMRAFWVGAFLSFFLAVGAPYGNMIIRGSYMALDFSTPGAIFLFLVLIGLLNVLFKVAASPPGAVVWALVSCALYGFYYGWVAPLDPFAPGFFFATFIVASSLLNMVLVSCGGSLVLNRAELILVYVMLLIVSALCTMGLSEQILPLITAVFYFASPENKWQEMLFPHFSAREVLVNDGSDSKTFYEGLAPGEAIPYAAWVEPLCWWAVFLLALYVTMVSVAVIIRRQWMERERLPYPITQVGLAMVRGEERGLKINTFFRQPAMWAGFMVPIFFGSLKALHRYDPAFPVFALTKWIPLVGKQTLQVTVSFAIVGFSYFINANIAAGIWFFHLLAKFEKEFFALAGVTSEQKITFGVADFPLMAYQGVGALLAMVGVGLWVGREHFGNVCKKALGLAPEVEDGDEIMSYRWSFFGAVGGVLVMAFWLWIMGTPLWVAFVFVVLALLIFLGITRIVAEAGLAAVRAPMTAPDLVILGLGTDLVTRTGVWNLSLAYMWGADVRVFVMATCTNALKLIEEMEPRLRRLVFWAIILALFIGALGAFWMIFHMAYQHGGVNLNGWFFKGAPETAYSTALRNMEPAGIHWPGLGFLSGGALVMGAMMWGAQRLPWWPVHPIGFPIGGNGLLNHVWFSVFLAWFLKKLIMRFGGVALYRRSQMFFLGLICGQVSCNGLWLIIDYFTGKVGNKLFWA